MKNARKLVQQSLLKQENSQVFQAGLKARWVPCKQARSVSVGLEHSPLPGLLGLGKSGVLWDSGPDAGEARGGVADK